MTNDLISKSAALEELEKHRNMWDKNLTGDMYHFTEVRQIINETPSPWIPVSERFPDDETEVLIQYGQSFMVAYHIFDNTIYPFGYEDEDETGWYDNKDDFICGSDEVIAWMPLPEPYKEAEK
jgi:hypothetical protein